MLGQQNTILSVALTLLLPLMAATNKASETENGAELHSQRYIVPDGGVAELLEFIKELSVYRPTTTKEDIEHRRDLRPALKRAAKKIIQLENDRSSPAHEAAEFILLADQVHSLAQKVPADQEETLADVEAYVKKKVGEGQENVAVKLAELTAKTCQGTGQYVLAAETYRKLGDLLEESDDKTAATAGSKMRATGERLLAMSKSLPDVPAPPEVSAKSKLVPLDIQMLGNYSVEGTLEFNQFSGNGLAELQKGMQMFGGIPFQVGEKLVRMEDVEAHDGILVIEGIPVKRRFSRLFILHATGHGSPYFVDGTKIGKYAICYQDGSEESIPIVYGEDVRDWWDFDEGKPVTRGRVVWTGRNLAADGYQVTIRLYLGVWKNPHPEKMVSAIDYISNADVKCRPFCVAMTVEDHGEK